MGTQEEVNGLESAIMGMIEASAKSDYSYKDTLNRAILRHYDVYYTLVRNVPEVAAPHYERISTYVSEKELYKLYGE